MTPMRVTKTDGGDGYANPFVGAIGATVAIDVDLSGLTNKEVDANGYLKAGVPLTSQGALVTSPRTKSTVAAGVAHQGTGAATGNGTIGSATGGYGAPAETITITMTGTGATAAFTVEGTKSGLIGTGAVGTAFVSERFSVTISDGSTDWEAGNYITFAVTAGADDKLFGVTVEPTKLVTDNSDTYRTGTFSVTVATAGLVNRDVAEDILGRTYTAAEQAAFADSSGLQLTPT